MSERDDRQNNYAKFRSQKPSVSPWISEYELSAPDLQNLQQQNPDVLQSITLDLSVAQAYGDPLILNAPGRAFTLLGYSLSSAYNPTTNTGVEQSEPGVFVNVRINADRLENQYPLKHNRGFRGNFGKLFLSWPAQANMGARLIILRSEREPWLNQESDNRFGLVEASNIAPQATAATVTNAAAILLPADLSRKVSTVRPRGATSIFVGASNLTAATGVEVKQDEILIWRNTAALYAITAAGSNTDVRITTEY